MGMGHPVVHFEIEGLDAPKLQRFYGELFQWAIDVVPNSPARYGVVEREANAAGVGIGGAVSSVPAQPSSTWRGPARDDGYTGHVTVYVEVPDVEAALSHAESLGGTRMQGPDPLWPGVETGKFADPEGHLIGVITAS